MKKIALFAAALVCLASATFALHKGQSQVADEKGAAGSLESSRAAPLNSAPNSRNSSVSVDSALGKSSKSWKMHEQRTDPAQLLEESRDYRALLEIVLARKDEKSEFYASQILARCTGIQEGRFDAIVPQSQKQQEAKLAIMERCEKFSEAELSVLRKVSLRKDPDLNHAMQHLLDRWYQAQTTGTVSARRALLKEIIDSNDRILVEQVGGSLITQTDPGKNVQFGGDTYEGSHAGMVVNFAWLAASCEATNNKCGELDSYVLEICARENVCAPNRNQAFLKIVERDFGEKGRAMYEKAMLAATSALRNYDADRVVN